MVGQSLFEPMMIPTGTVILRPRADLAGGNAASGKAADFTTRVGERQPWRAILLSALQAVSPVGLIRPPLSRLALHAVRQPCRAGLAVTACRLFAGCARWTGCHCMAAYAGLRPCVPVQGEVSPCQPLWPASQIVPRLPNPIEHTRPRGIHAPGHSFGVIQTMLLALANFG